ncbi:RNA helicase [Malassezia equina]|uniref:RNA helicase n=1 Tax=Malassezia equina TaxID=1381935 RepID=A0AAF0EDP0_9BASI|nr:RNA helicase [Malassezia equina]
MSGDLRRYASALVEGPCPSLEPLDPVLASLAATAPPPSAPPQRVTSHIWAQLARHATSAEPSQPAESGAAAALMRHLDAGALEASEKDRIAHAVIDVLQPAGSFDADIAASALAELLGFEHLELVMALLSKPSGTAAQLRRHLAQRAQGVGSAKEPLALLPASNESETYPNVYSSGEHGSVLTAFGTRYALPVGTTRVHESYYEEVTIPRSQPLPFRTNERLITLDEMDVLCRGAFHQYQTLNRLQSAVYPMAYKTNENLLVCAPTGAGKTDVAMLSILQCIRRHSRIEGEHIHVDRRAFKIVYVAPMKALVSEVVAKFSKRLRFLGLQVRELTGDMQLTRKEMAETQMIVTTPEKWDVVTRKPTGDGELALSVRLLIMDEVHLLHEERGAVIETIVARTQRLVESTQSMIRIVGLSATLPNYVDVADFLGVNRYRGMFYFGPSFRPVPLEQHFVGVRGKHGSALARTHLDRIAYEKVWELVRDGHPVMVFVHTRKDTVKTAQALLELGRDDDLSSLLTEGRDPSRFEKQVGQSRNKELRELYQHGIGIHHAGMLRSDRDLSEQLFAAGATRVLCCTATLAWGVNLPAYAVLIKGTDVYDPEQGKMVDLGILDVLQIFGRAGRPQFEDVGVSFICTSSEKLSHYIESITSSHPIESTFLKGIVDALNAEVALGSVSSLDDGVSWLGFTYLFTRLKKAPLIYGLDAHDLQNDLALMQRRKQWITHAANVLVQHGMVIMDVQTGSLRPTNVGRIASRYYLSYKTIEIFHERLRNGLREADALDLMSRASDFSQVALRESEEAELTRLLELVPCQVGGGVATAPGKVNILLQAHISCLSIEDFALVSDARYVAQNAGRILLALFDLSLDHGYAVSAASFLQLAKAVDRRVWPFEHPMKQCNHLSADVLHKVVTYADELEVSQIRALPLSPLADLLHANERIAKIVQEAAERFPAMALRVDVRPLPGSYVCFHVRLQPEFVWDERLHGSSLPLILWVEDAAQRVVFSDRVTIRPAAAHRDSYEWDVHVPLSSPLSRPAAEEAYSVVWSSLHWLAAEGRVDVALDTVACPQPSTTTPVLDVPLLTLKTMSESAITMALQEACGLSTLNAMQTQVVHTLAHTRSSVLLCAPYATGKATATLFAVGRALTQGAVVWIEPKEARVASTLRWAHRLAPWLGIEVRSQITRTAEPAWYVITARDALQWGTQFGWTSMAPSLIVLSHVHQMDITYELAVMHVRRTAASARIVATAVSLHTAHSFAQWLQVPSHTTFVWDPRESPYPVATSLATVDVPYSDTLVKAYAKPALDKMLAHGGPALLFAPTRSQCFTAAQELVARMATAGMAVPLDTDSTSHRWKHADLANLVRQGIGIWHPGLAPGDRAALEQMQEAGLLRAILCPHDVDVPFRAPLVIVLGTQYTEPGSRSVKNMSTEHLLALQRYAVRPNDTHGDMLILCQQMHAPTLERLIRTPLAVESPLRDVPALVEGLVSEIRAGRIATVRDMVAWLRTSYLAVRVRANPVYYDMDGDNDRTDPSDALSHLSDALVQRAVHLGVLVNDHHGLRVSSLGTTLPWGGLTRLQTMADTAHQLHTLPDTTKRVLDAWTTTGEARCLEACCAKIMLDAVDFPRAERSTDMQLEPRLWARLLLAQWLTSQLGGRSLADLDAVVRQEAGAEASGFISLQRDALLRTLMTDQGTLP